MITEEDESSLRSHIRKRHSDRVPHIGGSNRSVFFYDSIPIKSETSLTNYFFLGAGDFDVFFKVGDFFMPAVFFSTFFDDVFLTVFSADFVTGSPSISMSKMDPRSPAAIVGVPRLAFGEAVGIACSINSV